MAATSVNNQDTTLSGALTGYLRSNPSHAPIIRIVLRYPSRLPSYILAKSGILGG